METSKKLVEDYLGNKDWRVKENSNAPKSYGGLARYLSGEVIKDYWLREVYAPKNPEIVDAYRYGFFHIHDLRDLTVYCCGYSLRQIIDKGVVGVSNIPHSQPAKHFMSILNQVANLTTIFQNEIAGAVAFSSVDTLLAPFIKKDKLTYQEVKQHLQNFIFSINSNSRAGAEPAFTNVTLDITPPHDLLNQKAIIAGEPQEFTYKDCQEEMNMFNKAFCELMIQGDAEGKPFAYPIPTYNIHKRFDWDNPNNELIWEMAGKYGYPYFTNYINSDMNPEDARSMCCRLRLDLRELRKRNGGLFGSGDSTGSIGVVTMNLPKLGYIASLKASSESREKKKEMFYKLLDHYMELAKQSLLIKREYLEENILAAGVIPAFQEYVGTFDNHFNTIGLIGMNEMCVNLLGCDILSEEGKAFSLEVLDYMREKLSDYQEETGQLFNLEATPAESTAYRLAKIDRSQNKNIFTQGTEEAPYYTNSCHIPVKDLTTINNILSHQDDLQCKFTGGTVVHLYIDGPITGKQAKSIVKTSFEKYKLPYMSLSPVNTICPEHGLLMRSYDECPICGKKTDKYQRITGYIRPIKNFNKGKAQEFLDRNQIKL